MWEDWERWEYFVQAVEIVHDASELNSTADSRKSWKLKRETAEVEGSP